MLAVGGKRLAAAVLVIAAAGCTGGGTGMSADGKLAQGGTAVWAESPGSAPNYIFPFASSAYFGASNTVDFSYLMYRPLYWFGRGSQPVLNAALSLATMPVFNGRKVTITLKHYRWSNGTAVTAENVVFWLNMMRAVPQDYGGYSGFPANVTDIRADSPTTLTMTMDRAYSPTWFVYNDLSQVIPMPTAWDRTADGPSRCTTTVRDCAAVYAYLDAQSKAMSTYVSSPIWSVVDGPWRLSAFNADGRVTFVPNKSYSGPVKPKLAAFQEMPFASEAAEYLVLQSPAASTKIDVGYLPFYDAPAKPAGAAVGANPLAAKGYSMSPLYGWAINYYVMNFQSTTGNGPVLRQLYFRQAMAYLMNQAAVIRGPLRGYGVPTVGPVASTPATPFLSPQGRKGDPFPYNPAKAKALMTSHGWKVVPDGVTRCAVPSRCGPGIRRGQGLQFNFPYASGITWTALEMDQLRSNAARLGIKLNLRPEAFKLVAELAADNCVVAKTPCDWDMANWGGGWGFAPDYLPTGETLFVCGAIANFGGFCDKTNDALIGKTLTSNNLQDLYNWQDYLATKLPLMWQPNYVALTEIADNLKGVTPQSPTDAINPENWYFVN
jgi:peptide/nickel transport system substrate-binding protein